MKRHLHEWSLIVAASGKSWHEKRVSLSLSLSRQVTLDICLCRLLRCSRINKEQNERKMSLFHSPWDILFLKIQETFRDDGERTEGTSSSSLQEEESFRLIIHPWVRIPKKMKWMKRHDEEDAAWKGKANETTRKQMSSREEREKRSSLSIPPSLRRTVLEQFCTISVWTQVVDLLSYCLYEKCCNENIPVTVLSQKRLFVDQVKDNDAPERLLQYKGMTFQASRWTHNCILWIWETAIWESVVY